MLNSVTQGDRAIILIVDDEACVRSSLKRLLYRIGYTVLEAASGAEGMDKLKQHEVDLVISDLRMAGINGVEFLSRVAELKPDVAQILMSAYGDAEALMGAINACHLSQFLSKPWSESHLLMVVKQALLTRRQEHQLQQMHAKMERDLLIAAELQRSLLPAGIQANNYNIQWIFEPCSQLAGDGLDYYEFENNLLFYLYDVAGHGAAAAMESFSLQREISKMKAAEPEAIARLLNESYSCYEACRYFTLLYGKLCLSTGKLSLCQAGHPYPLHHHFASAQIEKIGQGGYPVGLIAQASYESIEVQLAPGDRLLLFSDGLLEILAVETIEKLMLRHAHENLAALLHKLLHNIIGGDRNPSGSASAELKCSRALSDDVSLLALEWAG